MIRRVIIILSVLLLTACAGNSPPPRPVPPMPTIPEPVPDHGPPPTPQMKAVVISWDIYVRDPKTGVVGSAATDLNILLLTCRVFSNARVKGPDGQYVVFPWGDTVKLPYDFRVYIDNTSGPVVLSLRCSGTLLQVQPGWRFECKSTVADLVVDRNSDIVRSDRTVKSISCLVGTVG